ncbi:MAG: tyrosine--tRNA ligase [Verrucomicrobiales bacterium]|jgi:tyrosyl-tRNA synthetase|nr:tyrosine--tRNA ligase [Verrucomicrobiales bacterium]
MSTLTVTAQVELLAANVNQLHSRAELAEKLKSGRQLRIKLGFDPTSPDLHLGHVIVLDKIRQFQDLGHLAVIVVGDYTARVGDPTGRSKTRPPLAPEKIAEHAQTYTDQVFRVLRREQTEIRYNGEWFGQLSYADVLRLNSMISVAQLLEREDFKQRYAAGTAISLMEFQYPLMQGYDSVMLKSDAELGGNDQLFNNLVGRDLQKAHGQEPQIVMVMPILTGTDGVHKMSKSLGNAIGITEPPAQMFGKAMSVSDETMANWRWLLGANYGLPPSAPAHPMEAKKQLAAAIVRRFHGDAAAAAAREDFELKFSKKDLHAADLPEVTVSENPIWLVKLLQELKVTVSGGDARRLIQQGGVKLNGEKLTDPKATVTLSGGEVLQAGKKFFARLKIQD